MSNEVSLFAGGNKIALKGAKSMVSALKGAAAAAGPSDLPEGGVYVSFSGKMGKYSIGQNAEDANPEEYWLVNVFSFEAGWVCWKGGAPAAKIMGSIFGEPVPTPDFNQHGPFREGSGDGWFSAKALMLRSLDRGIQGYFSTNTKSALREFGKLEGEIARRLDEQLPCWPVIVLKKEPFTAKGQKNYKPILEVIGWLGMRQVNEMTECESNEEILEIIERLLDEADADEANGVKDTTMDTAVDPAEEFVPENEDDDGIEDAEIVSEDDDADVEEADEDAEEEAPATEPEPATPTRASRAARVARAEPAAEEPARTGGLARRARARV